MQKKDSEQTNTILHTHTHIKERKKEKKKKAGGGSGGELWMIKENTKFKLKIQLLSPKV